MSYTSVELIRHYFDIAYPKSERISNQSQRMSGDTYLTFFGGSVDSTDFLVKSIRSYKQTVTALSLNESVTLVSSYPLVQGTVLVSSDESLSLIYTENVDYVIDYRNSTLMIKSSGQLAPGSTVSIRYIPYMLYKSGVDYQLDKDTGRIRRISSGSITDGETVYLDYSPLFTNFTEELMQSAVDEANGLIEKSVDPDGNFGADPTLQAAASYLAVASVCRSSALKDLSSGVNNDKTASVWMKIADRFEELSDKYLSAFLKPIDGYSPPTHS